jgi:acetyl-CoA C-acetyltransferase
MRKVVIVSGVRTSIGSLGGVMSTSRITDLGSIVIREAIERANIRAKDIDEVCVENVLGTASGENLKPDVRAAVGLKETTMVSTCNTASGCSLMLGAKAVATGYADAVVVGGVENPSLTDTRGYWILEAHGELARIVAQKHNVSAEDAEQFAAESCLKASKAISQGEFAEEVVPVEVPRVGDGSTFFCTDEIAATNKTQFSQADFPTIAVGAAALVFMSAEKAKMLKIEPMAEVIAWGTAERRPDYAVMAPCWAIPNVLSQVGFRQDDIDLYEIDEAFSVSTVAIIRKLGIDPLRTNIRGGSLALGYPWGASAARMLTTLLYAMKDVNEKTGMLSMCMGGKDALSLVVKRY